MNFLGTDTNFPSGPLCNVTIADTEFLEINHKNPLWKGLGSGRIFQFIKSPKNVMIRDVTVRPSEGVLLNSNAYFVGDPPENLILQNIKWPHTRYDLKIDNGGQGIDATKKYCPTLVTKNLEYYP